MMPTETLALTIIILVTAFVWLAPIVWGMFQRPEPSHDCEVCHDLIEIKELNTPDELTNTIKLVRTNVANCSFKDITQPAHCPSGEFLKLPLSPPWPDYIEYYFRCIECKADYRLSADTLGDEKHNSIQGELERY